MIVLLIVVGLAGAWRFGYSAGLIAGAKQMQDLHRREVQR